MNPSVLFLLQAFLIVALPVVLLRVTGLSGATPLAVVPVALGAFIRDRKFWTLAAASVLAL
jgi:hypothetical protein